MEVLIILLIILSVTIIVLTMTNLDYQKTLKTKKAYEDMQDVLIRERAILKDERKKISSDTVILKKENNQLKEKVNNYWKELSNSLDKAEGLVKKYINCRIELLKIKHPGITDSTSEIYELQDIINKKKNGNINIFDFQNKVDLIFDKIESKNK